MIKRQIIEPIKKSFEEIVEAVATHTRLKKMKKKKNKKNTKQPKQL